MEPNKDKEGRVLKGVIVSDKMQKTAVIAVTRLKKHPKIRKYYKITTRFKVHNENNQYKLGNKVMIQETKPMSRDKRWVIIGKSKL